MLKKLRAVLDDTINVFLSFVLMLILFKNLNAQTENTLEINDNLNILYATINVC